MPVGFGAGELLIVLAIIVVVFGAGRLSEVGSALGKSIRDFRRTASEPEQQEATADSSAASAAGVSTAEPASVATAEPRCPACSAVSPARSAFCGQCGARLENVG